MNQKYSDLSSDSRSMSKHTPGPWMLDDRGFKFIVHKPATFAGWTTARQQAQSEQKSVDRTCATCLHNTWPFGNCNGCSQQKDDADDGLFIATSLK